MLLKKKKKRNKKKYRGLGRRIDCHQGQEVPGCRGVVVVVEVEGGGKA